MAPDTTDKHISLSIDGRPITVAMNTTVAAAIFIAGITAFRKSVTGEARGPLCGMGICFECRVTIDNQPYARSCQILCQNGMDVTTDE
jgi:predicted molibdopterin-dependent oxidoreductase YjgC